MKKRWSAPALLIAAGLLCAGAGAAPQAPSASDPGLPAPPTGAANAASRMAQQFLNARQAGNEQAAYALMTPESKRGMPSSPQSREESLKMLNGPDMAQFSPELRLLAALFLDFQNSLHDKFRVLGPAADDPHIVLIRAYKVGTPLAETKILKIVTVADPTAGGAPRIDANQSALRADPNMAPRRATALQAVAQANLKQIALGILQYAQDHNNKLPDANRWVDEIMPYVGTESVFHDPSLPPDQKWSYAYNKNLSGVVSVSLANPAETVLVFESTLGTKNADDTGESLPKPGRHAGVSLFAFADGHVKALPDAAKPSFTVSSPASMP